MSILIFRILLACAGILCACGTRRKADYIKLNSLMGQKLEVDVEPSDTVLDLKRKLSTKQKLPVDQQRIIFEGKMLQDNKTLAEYNIKNNSVIHMVLRLRGGMCCPLGQSGIDVRELFDIIMEELIPLVSKLHVILAHAGESSLQLPAVAVVGAQSVGKSSVLEAIVGRPFLPKGTGIVTQRPLVLQLRYDADAIEHGEFGHKRNVIFEDFDKIKAEIKSETERLLGTSKNVSPVPIFLKIVSPRVVDLTLIDLPGITKVPVNDQNHDIDHQIREMIMDYIAQPSCIILALTSANTDIATSDSLQMAREVDPIGLRTIGVITKCDTADESFSALDVLQGRVYKLRRGYVGVVCKDKSGLHDARHNIAEEDAFFRNHPTFGAVSKKCGIRHLSALLNDILTHHIKEMLPYVKSKLLAIMHEREAELSSYGLGSLADTSSPGGCLLHFFTSFSQTFRDMISGRTSSKSHSSEIFGGARIYYIFNDSYLKTLKAFSPLAGLSDIEIRTAIRNSTGPASALFVPEIAFANLVKKQINLLEAPSLQCVDQVYDELLNILDSCDVPDLDRFVNMRKHMLSVVKELLKRCVEPTKNMIRDLIKIELAYINTNHPDFLKSNVLAEAFQQRSHQRDYTPTFVPGSQASRPLVRHSVQIDATSTSADSVTYSTLPRASHYDRQVVNNDLYSILRSRMGERRGTRSDGSMDEDAPSLWLPTIPKVVSLGNDPSEREVCDLIFERAIFFRKNIADAVPKCIMHFMVNRTTDSVQQELISNLYKKELYDELTAESSHIIERRERCVDTIRLSTGALTRVPAVSVGLTVDELLLNLNKFSKNKLPGKLKDSIVKTASLVSIMYAESTLLCTIVTCICPSVIEYNIELQAFGKIKLVLRENRYWVESHDKKELDLLLKNPVIRSSRIVGTTWGNHGISATPSTSSAPRPNDVDYVTTSVPTADVSSIMFNTNDHGVNAHPVQESKMPVAIEGMGRISQESSGTSEVYSFEVHQEKIEELKREALQSMRRPLVMEYDFRKDKQTPTLDCCIRTTIKIRYYQERALRRMFSNGRARSGIIVLPCGAGKTLTGILAACTVRKPIFVLTTSAVAVEQWVKQFMDFTNISPERLVTLTSDNKNNLWDSKSAGVVISTYTMMAYSRKHREGTENLLTEIKRRDWGLLIFDEVQFVPAPAFRRINEIVRSHCKLGLTATLVREDDLIKDLQWLIGPKLYEANWLELQEKGFLAKVICKEIWCPMTAAFYREYLRSDCAKKRKLWSCNPVKLATCEYLLKYHESRGDKVTSAERIIILDKFKNENTFNSIILSKVGDNALDIPCANVVIQISFNFASRRQEAQRLGRILRPKSKSDESGFNAFFYSLVSKDTQEMVFADKRQQFIIDQGYAYNVTSSSEIVKDENDLIYCRPEIRDELLRDIVLASDEPDEEEDDHVFEGKGNPQHEDLGMYTNPRRTSLSTLTGSLHKQYLRRTKSTVKPKKRSARSLSSQHPMFRNNMLKHHVFHSTKVISAKGAAFRNFQGTKGRYFMVLSHYRHFSTQNSNFYHEIDRIKTILAHTSQEPSYVYSESLKERIGSLGKEAGLANDPDAKAIVNRLAEDAERYHDTVVGYMCNRDIYNQAAQTKITNDVNLKYGIVGVSLMCVFGSLAVSLHPIFLLVSGTLHVRMTNQGCALGGYVYRPVFRQSRMKEETTNNMERYLKICKDYKHKMTQLHKDIAEQIGTLEENIASNRKISTKKS
ncbi:Dynamin-related protein DNM1 [Babesia sp. Xinjiang]|uniref:Dynamin-related protein DNM1 n=1 Tax=Babesia sp. Xinjiang TaxID=462227 RepID=UPI000A216F6C|nr:Dynamin-related protein DNM1 [Babesia sp. Xinjiang]ORM41872.1 Dynamin-related protein DNM1 [Babesia sp. Xinjiang]